MNLKEFSEKINYSENTIKTCFNRVKDQLFKKGIIISKEGRGQDVQYYILKGEENISFIHFRGKNLLNQKFGKLTVIDLISDKSFHKQHIWKCKCECGNICEINSCSLLSGNTKSCGCEKSINEIGNRYGKLIVIDYAKKPENLLNAGAYWLCKCDCGNTVIKNGRLLRSGAIQSCGCLCSKGEDKIKKILKDNNINFLCQYSFKDCVFPETKKYAKFDFYITDQKYLIEFDGEQHFEKTFRSRGDNDTFEMIKYRDDFKNQWCKKNNIPLIKIPYYRYEKLNIQDLLLKTSNFIIK